MSIMDAERNDPSVTCTSAACRGWPSHTPCNASFTRRSDSSRCTVERITAAGRSSTSARSSRSIWAKGCMNGGMTSPRAGNPRVAVHRPGGRSADPPVSGDHTGYMPVMTTTTPLTALALNCTLTPSPAGSSTQLLTDQVLAALGKHGVTSETIRVVDLDVKPGVEKDMGDRDAWPGIREKMLAADIFVLGTPTWMGHMSSVAQRVLERLDAELSETDDEGRL